MSEQKWKKSIIEQLNWVRTEQKRIQSAPAANRASIEGLKQLEVLRMKTTVRPKSSPLEAKTKRYHQDSNRELLKEIAYEDIPVTGGSRYYERRPLEVAIVCSEFMHAYYQDALHLHYVNPATFTDVFEKPIDLFLVVTSWKGLHGDDWKGVATPTSKKRQRLLDMMEQVKAKGIPVVFQSTEDPSNFDRFSDLAKVADYILTSDEAMIPEYQVLCGHDRIEATSFGVNPIIHNPVGATRSRKKHVLFAGSWMAKYPERVKDTEMLFDGVLRSDHTLDIVDRNYQLNLPDYHFPERYVPRVAPAIPYDALQQVSKCYDWVLNLNSIKYSKTMCARRVYESQALGNLILSNYSIAVNNDFPNVFTIHDHQEVQAILERTTQEEIDRLRAEGIRSVMSLHTVYDRIDQLTRLLQLDMPPVKRTLLVVLRNATPELEQLLARQSITADVICHESELTGALYVSADLVTVLDGAESYGEYYLEDLVNGFKYSDVSITRKTRTEEAHFVIREAEGSTVNAMIWREAFPYEQFSEGKIEGETLFLDALEWNEGGGTAMVKAPVLSVIVPIFNNGRHLTYKCFASLKRMDRFEESEIILVDDGSTDRFTRQAIDRLARRHGNVVTYLFPTGGSGSASRPRNKGVELARSERIAFLDPDNEVLSDRYAELLAELDQDPTLDFAVGHMKKLAEKTSIIALPKIRKQGRTVCDQPKAYLLENRFSVQSIQALVVNRRFLQEHQLEQVVGAVGQDSLFFQEMMLHANRVLLVNRVIHYYYAAVAGSTVNSLTVRFFERSVVREKARAEKFARYGVLDAYKTTRFEHFFEHWYLVKLWYCSDKDFAPSVALLRMIVAFYEPMNLTNPLIRQFVELADMKRTDAIQTLLLEEVR
ncbi:glycosyl transferase family 2 [Exiguobacterium sibiricum 255-15]|uniref:Glycosyl transferase family 2 n=1 Tax=Exiguobacterium sibiricum (strain DSM 17290 / CCUG 55495 / CIP 109462 / JCM 13490 / 255-15) TaxID=262543 RepID=B1YL49_EXIS2|nr:glycosyltransferase [Exiguobacterium sibiricum]ACB60281.1 glycosyl transferase family 2 [Exiguobacterium sibiricum 255-15]